MKSGHPRGFVDRIRGDVEVIKEHGPNLVQFGDHRGHDDAERLAFELKTTVPTYDEFLADVRHFCGHAKWADEISPLELLAFNFLVAWRIESIDVVRPSLTVSIAGIAGPVVIVVETNRTDLEDDWLEHVIIAFEYAQKQSITRWCLQGKDTGYVASVFPVLVHKLRQASASKTPKLSLLERRHASMFMDVANVVYADGGATWVPKVMKRLFGTSVVWDDRTAGPAKPAKPAKRPAKPAKLAKPDKPDKRPTTGDRRLKTPSFKKPRSSSDDVMQLLFKQMMDEYNKIKAERDHLQAFVDELVQDLHDDDT